jgi:site-specific DNA-cytosine methylase
MVILSKKMIVDFLDYGVPHRRERLITIGCRLGTAADTSYHPEPTHGPKQALPDYVSLGHVLAKAELPPIQAERKRKQSARKLEYHEVPVWNNKHMEWMKPVKEGASAFENHLCPKCKISYASDHNFNTLHKTGLRNSPSETTGIV